MGVGNFARTFAAVNCEISDFHLQAKGNCVKAAQIDSSTRAMRMPTKGMRRPKSHCVSVIDLSLIQ